MPNPEIEEFAKILVQHVRDATIQSGDRSLKANAMHAIAKRWKEAITNKSPEQVVSIVIPDVVDEAVFHLLLAIDQGLLKLSFTASNGQKVELPTDGLGELSGWYAGSGGWRALYSKERVIDDFADLK